jgi:Phosphate-induced protein 1 conserved region
MRTGFRVLALATALAAAFAAQAGAVRSDGQTIFRPTGKGFGELDNAAGAAERNAAAARRVTGHGIQYHGGPVMNASTGVNVYYIWYGDWSGNSATTILPDFGNAFGGSPYFNITTTYTDAAKSAVKNIVTLQGQTTDNYSHGAALSDAAIQAIVAGAIPALSGTPDPNGIYFVLTSQDVNETSGFCTQYCGWHTHGTISGSDIKYAFIGNPDRCPSACEAQSVGPNGNAGADGMASIISHELEEAVTDPDLNAWYDTRGYENADKCAWTFGSTYTVNGAQANIHLGTRDYLIQRNWVNASGGYCSMTY